jgi:ribonuclease HI
MTSSDVWQVHIDGAARGNPGPGAFAFIIQKNGSRPIEENGLLGITTNNLAEYSALVRALERAFQGGAKRLIIHSDSELLVKQMNGEYRVKNADLREMYDRAKELINQFSHVQIRHIRREQNSRADELCNQALDNSRQIEKSVLQKIPTKTDKVPIRDEIRQRAVQCLRSAAERWAEGDNQAPSPEKVWDEICEMLKEFRIKLQHDEE